MLGIGLDVDVREWFEQPASGRGVGKTTRRRSAAAVPRTIVPVSYTHLDVYKRQI